jgi:hypothetical protein
VNQEKEAQKMKQETEKLANEAEKSTKTKGNTAKV